MHALGLEIIGDLPIYVPYDSCDVWANPSLFQLDETGLPTGVAGCPPDYFSADGQLWGNPLYDLSLIHIFHSRSSCGKYSAEVALQQTLELSLIHISMLAYCIHACA